MIYTHLASNNNTMDKNSVCNHAEYSIVAQKNVPYGFTDFKTIPA